MEASAKEPVDARIIADGIVERIHHDHFEPLVHRVLRDETIGKSLEAHHGSPNPYPGFNTEVRNAPIT